MPPQRSHSDAEEFHSHARSIITRQQAAFAKDCSMFLNDENIVSNDMEDELDDAPFKPTSPQHTNLLDGGLSNTGPSSHELAGTHGGLPHSPQHVPPVTLSPLPVVTSCAGLPAAMAFNVPVTAGLTSDGQVRCPPAPAGCPMAHCNVAFTSHSAETSRVQQPSTYLVQRHVSAGTYPDEIVRISESVGRVPETFQSSVGALYKFCDESSGVLASKWHDHRGNHVMNDAPVIAAASAVEFALPTFVAKQMIPCLFSWHALSSLH